ncbi:MAG: hypothetical protein LBL25_03735, partial [Oscillospiraceae bacterium]|nr:hypothetical protein [Oscillospiraceae bacterium]
MGSGGTGSGARRLSFSGIMAALAVAALALGRVLPTGQLAFAAAASLFTAATAARLGAAWGLGVWAAASGIALMLLPGGGSGWLFALFFGYYPVVKLAAEKRRRRAAEWGIKLLSFAVGAAAALAVSKALGITVSIPVLGELTMLGENAGVARVLIPSALAAAFIVFDIGYSKLLAFYTERISAKIF